MQMQADTKEHFEWTEVYRRLTQEAPYIAGDAGEHLIGTGIKWANPKLIEKGQSFVKKNAFSVHLAHTAALVLGFSFKNLSTVLLRTGKFTGTMNSMDRYADTEDHLNKFYKLDIFQDRSDGHRQIQIVRRMHSVALRQCVGNAIAKKNDNGNSNGNSLNYVPDETLIDGKDEKIAFISALKTDVEFMDTSNSPTHLLTYNPDVLMSQFDMALTQYGFFALMYLFPASFGISDTSEMDGFVHLWAVLGNLLGIQDRYNLALFPNRDLYTTIHSNIGASCFKNLDTTTVMLMDSFLQAHGSLYLHSLSTPAFFYFAGSSKTFLPEFRGEELYKLLSWNSLTQVKLLAFLLFLMSIFSFMNRLVNGGFPVLVQWNLGRVFRARKLRQLKH